MKRNMLLMMILSLLATVGSFNSFSQSIQLGYNRGGIRTMDGMRVLHRAHKLKKQKRMARLNDGRIGPLEKRRIMKSRQALKRSLAHTYLHRKRGRFTVAIRL
jgi:hypothetical protein